MWKKLRNIILENIYGILGTLAFHMILVIIFLLIKISSTRNLIESLIMIEFEESEILEDLDYDPAERDIEFDHYVADYLENARSNIPVNIAERVDQQISTNRYVDEVLDELDENRNEEWLKSRERLHDLLDRESGDMIVENEDNYEQGGPEIFEGKTNIFYSLENRYHLSLPVPVYKCEGEGVVEVQILVDQRGQVVNADVPDLGNAMNEICLAGAARDAALRTRFNSNFEAPVRQQGTITYYFQAQ